MKENYKLLLLAIMLMIIGRVSARTEYIGPRPVDLGLSVLWGDKNIIDYNYTTQFYYWGGGNGITTVGVDEDYPQNISGTEYDVATKLYGNGWRMPTADEFKELYEKCSKSFSSNGVKFTAANGNSITLGLEGYIKDNVKANDYTYYWTGTMNLSGIYPLNGNGSSDWSILVRTDTKYHRYAPDAFGFNSSGLKDKDKICNYLYSNEYQCAIRPVKDKTGTDATAYAILYNGTLTFYYDNNKGSRAGKAYNIETSYTSSSLPGWAADSLSIKQAVFDSSFAYFLPTSTARWFGGYYNNLTSITGLNYLNTENVTNMDNMFTRCKSLKSIDVSKFNTSKVTIMQSMFYGCKSLETIDVSGFDTRNVTNMHAMFYDCNSLKSLDVSGFNTAKVKYFEYMFYGCRLLTSLDVSKFDTRSAISVEAMFYDCSKLHYLEVRNFNTSNVTSMGWMFYGCSSLNELHVNTFDTDKVTTMKSMFNNCQGLIEIDVSGFNTKNVANTSYMFRGCSKLEELCLGGFYTENVVEMQYMFSGCSALKTIYAKDTWNTGKVTNSTDMFKNCNSLVGGAGTRFSPSHVDKTYAHIDGSTSNPGYFTNMTPAIASGTKAYAVFNNNILTFYYDNKSSSRTGTKYEVKNSYGTGSLPGWVRDYYRRVFTKAVFDSSFASYRPVSTAYWFYNCSAMTTIVNIGNLNTSNVTSMAEMFRYCEKLNNLDLRTFDTSNVTDMSCMFCYCHSLSNLNISSFNTSKVTDMSHLFHQCPLSSIDVSSFNTRNVTDMSIMFAECKQLKSIDLKNFNTSKVKNMDYMFYSCSNLTTIYASSLWSTASLENGYRMFTNDINLVGSMGTVYTAAHTNQDYAHIDGGRCIPGYLYGDITTADLGPKEAYAVLKDGVLTFYYDNFKECAEGKVYPIERDYNYSYLPGWHEDRNSITTGVFDVSFADYRPTNTSFWFYELDQMTTLNNEKYLKTSEVTKMEVMFFSCKKLKALDVSGFNTSKVTTMHSMFNRCENLQFLDVSKFNTSNVTDMEGLFCLCNNLNNLDVSKFNTYNVKSMAYMFWGCNSLSSLDVTSFNTENVTNMHGMFYDCRSLNAIDVSSFNTAKVTDMKSMFMRCQSLNSLNLKNFNTSNVTDMSMMFYVCDHLSSLDVSSFNTSNVTNMQSMFDFMKCMKRLDLRNFNTSKVTNMRTLFSACDILEEVNLSSFDTRNVRDMTGMFYVCKKLKTIDISSFNTEKTDSMGIMFGFCSELSTIYTGSKWSTASIKGSEKMFASCTKLVGGAGTKYNSNHTDASYAHVDGGPSNPGYFTYKSIWCDVNGDGSVDVADIATIIDVMANGGNAVARKAADVNGDGAVDVADIATVISRMAELARSQREFND